MPRTLSCRKSLLISDVEVFNAWPTLRYCSANRRVLCLHGFTTMSWQRKRVRRNPTVSDLLPGLTSDHERRIFLTIVRAPDPSAAPSCVRHVASDLSRCVSVSLRGVGDHTSISPPLSKTRRVCLAVQTNSSVAASSFHRGRKIDVVATRRHLETDETVAPLPMIR